MNRTSKHVSAIVIALTLGTTAAGSAVAADSGFYGGLDLGMAQYPQRNIALDVSTDVLSSRNQKRTDLAWGVNAGYLATRYIGWEVAYHDFGETSAPLAGTSGTSVGDIRFASQGTTLALVGTVPFGKWEADWKLGYLFEHTTLSAKASVSGGDFQFKAAAKSQNPFAALGVGYNFSEHWNTSVQIAEYRLGADATGKVHTVTAAFAAAYRF